MRHLSSNSLSAHSHHYYLFTLVCSFLYLHLFVLLINAQVCMATCVLWNYSSIEAIGVLTLSSLDIIVSIKMQYLRTYYSKYCSRQFTGFWGRCGTSERSLYIQRHNINNDLMRSDHESERQVRRVRLSDCPTTSQVVRRQREDAHFSDELHLFIRLIASTMMKGLFTTLVHFFKICADKYQLWNVIKMQDHSCTQGKIIRFISWL